MFVTAILKEKGDTVVTVRPNDSILDVAKTLKAEGIGAAVVMSPADGINEQLVGMISERDIVQGLCEFGDGLAQKAVRDLMTNDVITCKRDHTAEFLMDTMTKHRIRHLPVLENGRMIGLVSIGDVVKARLGELKNETDMMQQYIAGDRA